MPGVYVVTCSWLAAAALGSHEKDGRTALSSSDGFSSKVPDSPAETRGCVQGPMQVRAVRGVRTCMEVLRFLQRQPSSASRTD